MFKQSCVRLLTAVVGLLAAAAPPAAAQEGTVAVDKVVASSDISCDGSTQVTLTITGQSGIAGDPEDILLVLDRSGSMTGAPITALKAAALDFVDIIDEATDGSLDGVIANGSRIGVVSFASNATLDQPLTTDAQAVKDAIDALVASGLTNHEAAFQVGQAELAGSAPDNTKQMVVMTDGQTTVGGDPDDDAAAARAAGTEIFVIGLGSVDVGQLNDWATDPDADHVFITADEGDLQAIFEAIGAAIVVPAATSITVVDTVYDDFSVSGAAADKGLVAQAGNVLTWTLDELGTETATLTYTVTHDNTLPGGTELVNTSVVYSDAEGHAVVFPAPTVNVRGCAANLELLPEAATNLVGDDHEVIAVVTDDFGDPVSGILVNFSVTGGPSVVDGDASAPSPSAGASLTDALGLASFTYTNSEASPDLITATAPLQPNLAVELVDTATKTWLPLPAVIDIKPGSDPNSYGGSSLGKIPVALLGSADFDVTLVDDASVLFGDAPSPFGDASALKVSLQDVNGDGFLDKVYHFDFPETHLDPSDSQGCLGGEIDGLDFLGCDAVNITPH